MFSGKTKRAMQTLEPLIDGDNYILFQSSWNKRDGNVWRSRGLDYVLPARVIDVADEFISRMYGLAINKEIVGIDEPFSFVPNSSSEEYESFSSVYAGKLRDLVLIWKRQGKKVIIPSIHAFFNKKPVHFVSEVFKYADRVEFCVESSCSKCHRPASLTQRMHNGVPSRCDEPLLVLDGEKGWEYFPVCAEHFRE